MASRQQVYTASQVGSLLDYDTEFVFSGSDDDFDAGLDEQFDPLEREQASCGEYSPETSPEPSPTPSETHISPGPSTQSGTVTHSRGRARGRRGRRGRGRGGRGSSSRDLSAGAEKQQWSSALSDVVVEPFERDIGPTIQVTADPTDMFLRFFTPDLIQHITTETNRYAGTCLSSSNPSGPVPDWSTNEEEMRAYLGLSILMGITKLPDLYDYWSTSEALHNLSIASRIPRKRFLEVQRYLHYTDNATITPRGHEGYDRLAKVRPVIESTRTSFLANYNPHRENAIDEAMVPFKGRSSLKQYVPLKPVRRGFKVWVRADSTNGYISDFAVYTGKDGAVEKDLGAKVVKKLTEPLTGGRYHIFFDNYFSSVKLFEDLLEDEVYACGTFRRDRRGTPQDMKDMKLGDLQRGESVARQRGNLVATVWRDRRLVYVMSTNSDLRAQGSVQRKDRDGTSQTVPCPTSVVDYNRFMGGVDHADQLRNYYRVRCKSRKFYRYLFWFAFDCSVVNAFILWKNYQPLTDVSVRQQSIKNFRLALANGLIGSYNSRQRYALPQRIREASLDSSSPATKRARMAHDSSTSGREGHFPIRDARVKCVFCWNNRGERHETNVRCRKCGKALCVEQRDPPHPSCFERYHLHTH